MAEPTRPDADTGDDATPDLKATYPDMEHARKAVKGLERRGVEGANITLLGEADAVSHRADNMGRDERMLSYAWRSAVSGFVIGSAVGAGLGLLMGVIVFGWLSGGMWATISGGVLVGGGLGVLLGAIVRLPQSDAGLAAVENEVDGPVELGVHTLGADEHATAQEALAAQEPAEIATVEGDVRGAHHGSEEPEASMSSPPTRQEPRPTPPPPPRAPEVLPVDEAVPLSNRPSKPAAATEHAPAPPEPSTAPGPPARPEPSTDPGPPTRPGPSTAPGPSTRPGPPTRPGPSTRPGSSTARGPRPAPPPDPPAPRQGGAVAAGLREQDGRLAWRPWAATGIVALLTAAAAVGASWRQRNRRRRRWPLA